MDIICHRGNWMKAPPQNSLAALRASADFSGIEIDLKNLHGEIVISHDPIINSQSALPTLSEMLKVNPSIFFALNIKEDGLAPALKKTLDPETRYMCFDLSSPELMKYKAAGLKVFERFGDFDRLPDNLHNCAGLVVDVFGEKNWNPVLENLRDEKLPLFFISPELHQQNVDSTWPIIRDFVSGYEGKVMLCTDFPERADSFFNRG
jgi:glycerophosphoryl diester phosphodiesterase